MVETVEREQLTYRGLLAELLLAECDDRDRCLTARRVRAAGLPREMWLADFDYDANPAINAAIIHPLPLRVDQETRTAVLDRRQRHRKDPSAD